MSSAKGLAYEVWDVFAETPLQGNPLAVVFGAGALTGDEMQALARETNLSETSFVLGAAPRGGGFAVRIFTPMNELPYAGHPTLGTASALRARLAPPADDVLLQLGIGAVRVRFEDGGLAWLESPAAHFEPWDDRAAVAAALGVPLAALDPALPVLVQTRGPRQLFAPLRDRAAVESARVDAAAYERLCAAGAPGSLYVFARGARAPENHFTVRLFAPAYGVPEDPATGSAAGFLGAYLVRQGERALDVRLEQGHAIRRPSLLRVRARGAAIEVGGRALRVARGEWL